MLKKFIIAVGGFIVVFLTLGAVKSAQINKMASTPHTMPATAVSTSQAQAVEWHSSLHAIGTLAPVEGVTLGADADGTIMRIAVDSGAVVKAGDLIIELDTTVEAAQLAAAEARAELAQANIDRTKELLDSKAISKSEYDVAQASTKQARADVEALKALIAKKQIRAPFAGRVGIRLVNVGQFIARGAPLIPLQQADPIFVNFSVPQRNISALSLGQKVSVTIDAFTQTTFEATLTAINSEVDSATRNVSVQATLPNPDEQLRAGMFAQINVEMPQADSLVVIPATAVAYASYGNSVFIVEKIKGEDGQEFLGVRQQFVKLGGKRGDLVAITEGVKPGEDIVTAGVFKLRNGVPVQVNNDVKPAANPDPTPHNS
ncbi:MAG: efflux RND transporter periplasmic adaptor subunit [Opitutaceae bacterium]|nr:efflux RND transporter periplasmic adaptor subunit [Opitutaceae bacterium]MBP9912471.1 efflux RND transporter periplasmic adaptor subunit [Opitutaceae bacterium]